MKISTVILDWAGTTVDFGCFAPVAAFQSAFASAGLYPTMEETRAPMGTQKRAHIQTMLSGERLGGSFRKKYGRDFEAADVDAIYGSFEPALFSVLEDNCAVMPGVLETVRMLREAGIRIGSTTGYTAEMMEIVTREARAGGYASDALVCPDETGGVGRPYPYMIFRNLEKLGEVDVRRVLKMGDTAADIMEGKNAGCVSVGALRGSSMMGLTEAEYAALTDEAKAERYARARIEYIAAGADYVIESIEDLPALIEKLNGGA